MPGLYLVIGKETKAFHLQRDLYRGERGNRQFVRVVRVVLREQSGNRILDPKAVVIRPSGHAAARW